MYGYGIDRQAIGARVQWFYRTVYQDGAGCVCRGSTLKNEHACAGRTFAARTFPPVARAHASTARTIALMEARELDLAVVPAQSCFVGLPRALVHRWGDTSSLVLHLRWQGGEAHVGWGGSASTSAGALEVPAALAEALGMRPPMRLRVCPVQVPVASAVSVQPESAADWEAAQQAADELEAQVLGQVLVVGVGQRLPLWLGRTSCIWLRVERSEPAAAAVRLGRGTELLVDLQVRSS